MGIQDRDYYWKDRNIDGSRSEPPGRNFRAEASVFSGPSEVRETYSPERLLRVLTVISALIVLVFIGYQARVDRAEERAQQEAAQKAMQASIANEVAARERAIAAAEQQARMRADQLEQKKRLLERLNQDAERQRQRAAAWERFYQPSLQCQADWTVECANTLIKARNEFAAKYGG